MTNKFYLEINVVSIAKSINTIKMLGKSNKITRKVKNCNVTAKFLFLMLLENYSSTGLHGKPWHGQ